MLGCTPRCWRSLSSPLLDGARLAAAGNGPRTADAAGLVVTVLALLATPLLLGPLLRRLELMIEALDRQQAAIAALTLRDGETGVFLSHQLDTLPREEIDRARRYRRALTVAIVAVDGWPEVIRVR